MSFFISDAIAETGQAAAQQPNMISALLPFIILFAVFYFLLIRPQSKRAKEHKKMVEAIGKGDEVITNGGLVGKITAVSEQYATVELAEGVQVKVQKSAINAVLPKGTIKSI